MIERRRESGLERGLAEFAVGPPVFVRLSSHARARTAGSVDVIFRALDAETYETYQRLVHGIDGRNGDRERADRFLAAATVRAIAGLTPPDVDSFADWFCYAPAAGPVASAIVPEYLEHSLPDQAELDLLELAAYLVIEAQGNQNPYQVGSHLTECDRAIWEDQDEERLLSAQAIVEEGECAGCLADRKLYARAIKELGTSAWIDAARRALSLARYLDVNPGALSGVAAREWLYVETARAEIKKREAYEAWEAGERAKEEAKKR